MLRTKKDVISYNVMLIPLVITLILWGFLPDIGVVMAWQDFDPTLGFFKSPWVGWKHFKFAFMIPDCWDILRNTLIIAISKLFFNQAFSILLALLLNEVRHKIYRKIVQNVLYLPNFISWVILSGVILSVFSLGGPINKVVEFFGGEPVMFMASNKWFRKILVGTSVWKTSGWNTIIYLAALTAVNPELCDAAACDGANRFQRLWHVTLPAILPTIILLACLNLGNILNAGFDQIFNLANPLVYETADIIDTYVYRAGMLQMQYSFGAAIGTMRGVVGLALMGLSHLCAYKFAGYRIF